ncbi:lytic transglycosylase domain-containing protein [Arhodomonas sp. AD133]|uniref:lytic transglycosylase domain-containing protein n=1 Tax=Arhodomonas sp. AD133 TaxID=3415009 RepID=UPI003EBAF643
MSARMRATLGGFVLAVTVVLASTPVATASSGQAPDPALRKALERALESSDSFRNRFDAEVWLMDMSTRLADDIPDPEERMNFLRTLHYEATRAELEPEWVLAVIEVESDFRRFAISSAGARGYMQIMPFWLEELDRPDDNLFRTETNLRMGCTILRHYLNIENGNLTRALARYNGSLGKTWYPNLVFDALREEWHAQ